MTLKAVTGAGGISASNAQESTKILGAAPARQMVATRTGLNGVQFRYNVSNAPIDFRMQHCLPFGAEDLVFIYAGIDFKTIPFENVVSGSESSLVTVSASVAAGGSGYAVGDIVTPTVSYPQVAPTLVVQAVSSGAVTALGVIEGGMFNAVPATGLATTHSSGSGDNALTVTLTVKSVGISMRLGLEQSWGTQTGISASNPTGVIAVTKGGTQNGAQANLFIPAGEVLETDPLPVNLASGTLIGSRVWCQSGNAPVNRLISNSSGLNEVTSTNIASSPGDQSAGGTYPTTGSTVSIMQPIAIMGRLAVPRPSFLLIGDSICRGQASIRNTNTAGTNVQDTLDAHGNMGWIEKAIDRQFPWSNFGVNSDQIANMLSGNARMRIRLMKLLSPSHVLDQGCVNDFVNASVSFATMQGYKIAWWNFLYGLGIKEIWVPTCTPSTTSTRGLSALPTIAAGGTGYANNATFDVTAAGGTQSLGASVINVSTNGSGVVTTVNSITNIGYYTTVPSTPNSPTGGAGSGLSLNLQYDGWLDLVSQTPKAANTAIQAWNAWLRAGNAAQYGVTKVLDLGTDVESAAGSGLWPAGTTLDGVHPTTAQNSTIAGHQAAAFATAAL